VGSEVECSEEDEGISLSLVSGNDAVELVSRHRSKRSRVVCD
jgi:hypothetical protein